MSREALRSIACYSDDELQQALADCSKSLAALQPYNGTVPGARAISETYRHRELIQAEIDYRASEADDE